MSTVKMYLSYNNNEKVVEIPVIPDSLPDVAQELSHEEITTHTKTLTLLGQNKPKSFTLELWLPTKDYYFCKGNGREVLEFMKYVCDNRIPARIVISEGMTELMNMAISIKRYSYRYDRSLNIRLTAECVEYVFLTTPTEEPQEQSGVLSFAPITVRYNGRTAQVQAANIDGSNLVKAREVIELLGREVTWNAEKKRVCAGRVLLDIHTRLYDGTAYCFIRDIAATLGLGVEYDERDKSVTLTD